MPLNLQAGTNAVTIYTVVLSTTFCRVSSEIHPYLISDEDRYVKLFGNKADNTHEWIKMKEWCEEKDQLPAKKLCAAAHKRIVSKQRILIDKLAYKTGMLSFNNVKYKPMRLVYVEYNLDDSRIPPDLKPFSIIRGDQIWYITQGFSKDGVFFLNLVKNSSVPVFQLSRHVTGLKHKYF